MGKKEEEAAKKAAATRSRMARVRVEMKQKTIGYILAAFGLVAGLAWNDAIKGTIEYVFPITANTVFAKILYALIMTCIVVMFSVYTMNLLEDDAKKKP